MSNFKKVMDDTNTVIIIDINNEPDWKIKYRHNSGVPFELTEEEQISKHMFNRAVELFEEEEPIKEEIKPVVRRRRTTKKQE